MTETRQTAVHATARIRYPHFTDDKNPKRVNEINGFYEALQKALCAYADEISASKTNGIHTLQAEYRAFQEDDALIVTYSVFIRHRGRIVAKKELRHTWKDGALILPISRFFQKKNRRVEK